MATYDCTIKDDSGSTRIEGTIDLPAGLSASTINLVVVGGAAAAGQELRATSSTAATWTADTVRAAAGVPAGAPTGTELPIAFDSTAVSGGLYVWTGAAWVKAADIP